MRRAIRWGLLAVGLVGLVCSQLISVQLATGRGASADTSTVDAGSAIASATVLGAVPIVGNTNLSVSVGDSLSSYQESEARSSSDTLDLGGLGVILANTTFCGSIILPADKQPQPLTDDTVGGSPSMSNHLQGGDVEAVTETPSPVSSSATTTPVGQTIPGLLTVGGQTTTAVDFGGTEREASSSAALELSLGSGLVDLKGLRWSAVQHTGATPVSQGSFAIGSLTVGGATLPTLTAAELATAVSAANAVLKTLGLTVILPTVSTDPSTGTVTVTPLQVTVGRSALSDVAVAPLIGKVSALEALVNGQTASGNDCAQVKELGSNLLNSPETVANVALGVFSAGGGFDLDVGGVTADTMAPPSYADPFGSGGAATTGGGLPPVSGSFTGGLGSFPTVSPLPAAPSTAGTTTTPPSTVPPQSAPATGALSSATHCETTSPAGAPGCWSGDAAIVGAVAVLGGAALFLADFVKSRRSRRRHSKEALT